MNKFEIVTTIDYTGYTDYYSGHGHAFADKDLLACILFSVSVDYSETVKEIKEQILEDILSLWNIDYLTENKDLQEEISNISDGEFIKSVNDLFYEDIKDSDNFFLDMETIDIESEDCYDLPSIIGYVHIYRKEE